MSIPTLDINEIFFSIQGESSWTGMPCVFVRLSFCNLRCAWCDSEYTFAPAVEMSLDAIVESVASYPCRLVEVTGGEPLLQEQTGPLMTRLCDAGYTVLLETSGSLDVSRVDPRVHRIVDLKCPGSGMQDRNRYPLLSDLTERDELKFVIADRTDYEWARNQVRNRNLAAICTVLMSPVFGRLENVRLAEWILEDGLPVRFQVQVHKYIWAPDQRGV
jgi:7-carboxy-7-deazaguanine synthase